MPVSNTELTLDAWRKLVDAREISVGVVGLGYVGLPLAIEIARAGFRVVGVDISTRKVEETNAGKCSHLVDITDRDVAEQVSAGRLRATTDFAQLAAAHAIIICVPTPLNKTKDPDVSFIVNALTDLRPHLRAGHLLSLESTTYPGFTREVVVPMLEETGLAAGKDFFVSFSPERIDPGNKKFMVRNTTKIVGGYTRSCLDRTLALYAQFIEKLHPVSSLDSAEMVKLLENTFRAVNIGLVNELAQMCHKLGVNTWEVIDAAATKPFGFMPFYPGPGLGGHCIPIDPLYLSWKLKTLNYQARFIELAHAINSRMPTFAVQIVQDALNDHTMAVNGAKILLLGVAYKRDIDDPRESPAVEIVELLEHKGAHVAYHDPYIPSFQAEGKTLTSVPLENLDSYDAVVIVTDHTNIDYAAVVERARLVVDTRNATKGIEAPAGRVYTL
jgi:UDP-N-acetyl-D-glucosamine dehydrogenase